MKYTRMQNEIQNDEVLKRAFSKNPHELDEVEQKAAEQFLKRKLAEVREFRASRTGRDGK